MVRALILVALLCATPAIAHMADRPDLDGWFMSLRSKNALCCDFTEAKKLTDVEWDTQDGHYRVYLQGHWFPVPDDSVVTSPNLYGPAIVWPIYYNDQVTGIRCFIPGTLS